MNTNALRKILPLVIIGLVVIVTGIIHTLSVATNGPPGRAFRLGLIGQAINLDPVKMENHADKLAASSLYESLLRYDESTQSLKPGLANNWGYARDGRSVVFMLKTNVFFHNGKRMTAEDVKKSWESSLKKVPNKAAYSLFENISGVREFVNGASDSVQGIKVIDPYTVRVYLTRRDSSLVYRITNPAFWIYDTSDQIRIPAGTGPYKLAAYIANKGLQVYRFKHYHGVEPSIPSLEFILFPDSAKGLEAFRSGHIDYLDSVPLNEIEKLSDAKTSCRLIKEPVLGFYALAMNVRQAPYNQLEFRRALSYGIDRQLLIKNVLGGSGRIAKGLLPIGIPGYNRALQGYSYDPETALDLLGESSYLSGYNPQTIKLTYNADPGHKALMEGVMAQLETMGISVEAVPVEWQAFESRAAAMSYSFFRLGWDADYPDADSFLYPLFHSSQIGAANLTGYSNPVVDRLLDQARAETASSSKRIDLLRKAEQIIIDDAPMVWLFQKEAVKAVAPDVMGFELDGIEMIDWSKVHFKETNEKTS